MNDVARVSGVGLPSRENFLTSLQKYSQSLPEVGGDFQYLKLNKDDGIWEYGQESFEVDTKASRFAVDPRTMQHGYIAWHMNQPEEEIMVPIARDLPSKDTLPPVKAKQGYQEQHGVIMVGVAGPENGEQFSYKASTKGALKFFYNLTQELLRQGGSSPDAPMVPIIRLFSSSYENKTHGGTTWNPMFEVVEWRNFDDASPVQTEEDKPEPEAKKPTEKAPAKAAAPEPVNDEEAELEAEYAAAAAENPTPRRRMRRG